MKTTAEQHHQVAKLLAENAARKAQVKALRKQRTLLLNTCKDFVFLEKTNITKKQVRLQIDVDKMKHITFSIDNSCQDCQKALRRVTNWDRHTERYYGSVNKKTGKFIKGVIIRPDYNASGHRTHYHIENE